ncbi:MAG: ferrous iron transporter B [Candidatus Omnitrophica bacterium]|nr:ferrous iron transporter B [Candidatus Omnitrophota bacterium]
MKNKRILLMGNPNVGKSAVFSRISGVKVNISNYPGSTVEFLEGKVKVDNNDVPIIDVPGTYSLKPTSTAEEVAVNMINNESIIVNVIDSTNLERNLFLTLQILELGLPTIIVLNIWDETKHKGITIDIPKLEKILGVPVVATCGISGEGIKELVEKVPFARTSARIKKMNEHKIWEEIGRIINDVQELTHRHHTLLERIEDLSIQPVSGLFIAAIVLYVSFMIIRTIGEGAINFVFDPLFEKVWMPVVLKINSLFADGSFLQHFFIGNIIDGKIDLGMSFGILTTGIYIPIAAVLPYILSFYLVLGILEDLGYLPRLAVLMDNLMHKLGLHGYAIIPFILGLGCNVPGAMAIRGLEGKREKFIAATLMATAVPCMAQIAMIIGLLGERGGQYLAIVFGTLFIVLIIKGVLMNKFIKGESPEILLEIPPYRIPAFGAVIKKLWVRVSSFLKEAVPFVLIGVAIVNVLYAVGIIDFFSKIFAPVLTYVFGLPKEAISALLVGFLRKDVAVGMLAPLGLSTKQLIIGSTVLALYFPCIATFSVLIKEIGIKDMAKAACLMLITTLIVGGIMNLFL